MKERITLTIESDIVERIDKEMIRHQMRNKSKFIEFLLRNTLFNIKERLNILEKQRDHQLARFKAINEDVLIMREAVDRYVEFNDSIGKKMETVKDEVKETDQLNNWE